MRKLSVSSAIVVVGVTLFPQVPENAVYNPKEYITVPPDTVQRIAELAEQRNAEACTIIEYTREEIAGTQCNRHRSIVFETFKNANGKDCYQVSVADYTDNLSYFWKSYLPDTKAPDAIKVFTNCDMQANQLPANVLYTFSREFHAGGACSIASANLNQSAFLQQIEEDTRDPQAALAQFLEVLRAKCPS